MSSHCPSLTKTGFRPDQAEGIPLYKGLKKDTDSGCKSFFQRRGIETYAFNPSKPKKTSQPK